MGRIVLASVLVVSFSALVGCGASATAQAPSVVPASTVSTTHHFSAPPPMPGETVFSFDDSTQHTRPAIEHTAISCKPNVQEKRGTIHAAY